MAASSGATGFDRRPSIASTRRWSHGSLVSDTLDWYQHLGDIAIDLPLVSPLDGSFDSINTPKIADLDFTLSPCSINDFSLDFDEDDGIDGGAGESTSTILTRHVSRAPDLAMIAPWPLPSPLLDFHMPAFCEFSDQKHLRALVDHFCNQLSHLIVFREETGNPFQQLVLPLSTQSSPVMNAIYALTSAHLEYRGVNSKVQSLKFHSEAIKGLATKVANHDKKSATDRNELLAAIMLLVYYEVVGWSRKP